MFDVVETDSSKLVLPGLIGNLKLFIIYFKVPLHFHFRKNLQAFDFCSWKNQVRQRFPNTRYRDLKQVKVGHKNSG